ncbi:hypothetical protein ACN9ML_11900 [Dyadobacter endophyticus]|uniref:hypothetical protein n=1 Tax=Dyadobacter endophyticus TaxID=1749036 RepID=UPI003CF566BA
MTEYTADTDLIDVLCQNGFIETTSLLNATKGKREFKLSKASPRYIYFDYINIRVHDRRYQDEKVILSSDDVRAMIFYFKCDRQDYKAIRPDGDFKFADMSSVIVAARKELQLKEEFPRMQIPEARIRRALKVFDSISIPV